eukprot:GGOE01026382.1.p3 GENE.GGOE01026382.1~~GGOE01026382.1.p3  ORF type:complete len:160 (+),score=37.42 GGOE01026382.1:698-1177(+)
MSQASSVSALSLVDVVCNCSVMLEGARQVVTAEGVQTLIAVLQLSLHSAVRADSVAQALHQKAGNTLVLVLKQVSLDPTVGDQRADQPIERRQFVAQFAAAKGWSALQACQFHPLVMCQEAHCHEGSSGACQATRSFVMELLQDLQGEEPPSDACDAAT